MIWTASVAMVRSVMQGAAIDLEAVEKFADAQR